MIDIHNHIIFGVDDGPSTIKDSMRMLLEAEKLGVKAIITTPHFHKGLYNVDRVQDNFLEIKSRTVDFGIDLFLGYEVFLSSSLPDLLAQRDKYTLNHTKYLLFELPFDVMPMDLEKTIMQLHAERLVPIIAHPERYKYFVRKPEKFIELVETGCLVQLDAASIVGVYGSNVKNFCKEVIDLKLVNFIASDAHKPEHYTEWYQKAFVKVKHWAGKEYCDKIFIHNQTSILNEF